MSLAEAGGAAVRGGRSGAESGEADGKTGSVGYLVVRSEELDGVGQMGREAFCQDLHPDPIS